MNQWALIDPLHGSGYQFWSGIGGAIIGPVLLGALYRLGVFALPTRCQQIGCRRSAAAISEAGVPFCEKHLPDEDTP